MSSLLFISTFNHHCQQKTQTMQDSKPLVLENPEAELDDDLTGFDKSLKELKDLCSQLHYAADYCEASFINAESVHKNMVMENTKEYLSKAVVTVVDHLGSVAANLDYQISQDNSVSETEFRINGLKQRLVTCQQYSHKLALTRLCWNAKFPRFHPRYIFPPMPDLKRSIEVSRKSVTQVAAKTVSLNEFEAEEEAPLFLYTCDHKPNSGLDTVDADSASVLPVRDGLSMLPKARNPFHFENTRKIKRTILSWKLKHHNDIFSFGRRSKRAT
ncbi:unnamed protein product [Camellia sinensis]